MFQTSVASLRPPGRIPRNRWPLSFGTPGRNQWNRHPKTISSRQVGYNPENIQTSQNEKNTVTEQERIRALYRDSYERIARRESDSEKALDKGERTDRYKANRHIPSKVRNEVWGRDEGKCVICGSQDNLHFDHIIPLSRGGGYTSKNIQILCSNCNLKKSNKIQ